MTTSPPEGFESFSDLVVEAVEAGLERCFDDLGESVVGNVARYIALGGGHRWRAMTTIASGGVFSSDAADICLPYACGVELAHAASMLLDDLPSMDDARFRRGKPCAHTVFPAWAVDLAPVLMVNMAYEICLTNPLASEKRRVTAVSELSRAARCMIDGQHDDLAPSRESFDKERLIACYARKSGALYGASAKAGGVLCGAGEEDAAALFECGLNMGIAYQLLDDITDVVAGIDEVGKESGMDAGKITGVDLFGLERTHELVTEYQDRAGSHLERFGLRSNHPLVILVRRIRVIPNQIEV